MNTVECEINALVLNDYGLEGIKVKKIEIPKCGPKEVLIQVYSASMNPYDWHQMSGNPYLLPV